MAAITMTVAPNWNGPAPTNSRIADINMMREDMWYTFVSGLLNAGFLVPGWDLTRIDITFPTNRKAWIFFWIEKTTGVEIRSAVRFHDVTFVPDFVRTNIDRALGDGYEDWAGTTLTRATFTVNASTNVIEAINWN